MKSLMAPINEHCFSFCFWDNIKRSIMSAVFTKQILKYFKKKKLVILRGNCGVTNYYYHFLSAKAIKYIRP